jgi:hypothetical protein
MLEWRVHQNNPLINLCMAVCDSPCMRIPSIKQTPWESASELYRPSDRRLSTKLVPTFADRGCHVVSVMDPFGCNLDFLERSCYFFLPSSSSVLLRRLSGPCSRTTTRTSQKVWWVNNMAGYGLKDWSLSFGWDMEFVLCQAGCRAHLILYSLGLGLWGWPLACGVETELCCLTSIYLWGMALNHGQFFPYSFEAWCLITGTIFPLHLHYLCVCVCVFFL